MPIPPIPQSIMPRYRVLIVSWVRQFRFYTLLNRARIKSDYPCIPAQIQDFHPSSGKPAFEIPFHFMLRADRIVFQHPFPIGVPNQPPKIIFEFTAAQLPHRIPRLVLDQLWIFARPDRIGDHVYDKKFSTRLHHTLDFLEKWVPIKIPERHERDSNIERSVWKG